MLLSMYSNPYVLDLRTNFEIVIEMKWNMEKFLD